MPGLVASHYAVLLDEERRRHRAAHPRRQARRDDPRAGGARAHGRSCRARTATSRRAGTSEPAVPTWNFVSAHLYGMPECSTPTRTCGCSTGSSPTSRSGCRSPADVGTAENSAYVERIEHGTVGFRHPDHPFVAKRKLSQNKSAEVVERIIDELRATVRTRTPRSPPRCAARTTRCGRLEREPTCVLANARHPGWRPASSTSTSPTAVRVTSVQPDRGSEARSRRPACRRSTGACVVPGPARPARALLPVGHGLAPPRPRRRGLRGVRRSGSSRHRVDRRRARGDRLRLPRRALGRCPDPRGARRRLGRRAGRARHRRPARVLAEHRRARGGTVSRHSPARAASFAKTTASGSCASSTTSPTTCSTAGSPMPRAGAAARGVVGVVDYEMRWNRDAWARRAAGGLRRAARRRSASTRSTSIARSPRGSAPATRCPAPTGSSRSAAQGDHRRLAQHAHRVVLRPVSRPRARRAPVRRSRPCRTTSSCRSCAARTTRASPRRCTRSATSRTPTRSTRSRRSDARGSIEHAQLAAPRRHPALRAARRRSRACSPSTRMDDRDVADRSGPAAPTARSCSPSCAAAGVELALGSDAPVAPLDPWVAIAAAVGRTRDGREPWHPEQAIEARAALAASTRRARCRGAGRAARRPRGRRARPVRGIRR